VNSIPEIPLLIDGQLIASKTTQWHDVINPSSQEVVARVPIATTEEVELAIASAKKHSLPGAMQHRVLVPGSCSGCSNWCASIRRNWRN